MPLTDGSESGGEQRDGAEQCPTGLGLFEELDPQDRGQASENIEVLPLDDISSRNDGDYASEVWGNACRHIVPPPLDHGDG